MEYLSGFLAEFGKNRNTDYDFPPHYMWAENNTEKTSPYRIPVFAQQLLHTLAHNSPDRAEGARARGHNTPKSRKWWGTRLEGSRPRTG